MTTDCQALLTTKHEAGEETGKQCLVCKSIFVSVNLYLVENQPGVNVPREDLILCHSLCGVNALKASWDVHPGVENVSDPWDKAKCQTCVQQNIRLLKSFSTSGFCDKMIWNCQNIFLHLCNILYADLFLFTYFCLFVSFPWLTACQKTHTSFHEVKG